MFDNIKITINGTEIDFNEIIKDNDGEPLDAQVILDAVKYELENVSGESIEDVMIVKVRN